MFSFQSARNFNIRLPRIRRNRKQQKGPPAAPDSKSISSELNKLVRTVEDPSSRRVVEAEIQSFHSLFNRYLVQKARPRETEIEWDRVNSPSPEQIIQYESLPTSGLDARLLHKLAVLKVNGGLGASMGMNGAKTALEVKDDMTFLDLTIRQIEHLSATHHVDVPLLFMTSYATHSDTIRIVKKHATTNTPIRLFKQSRYPRILKETLLPYPKSAKQEVEKNAWYPPGHGELYDALVRSGLLDSLLREGREYLFVSNSDNLGAVVDQRILQHMVDSNTEFLMEVTDKTMADVKGGTLVDYDGSVRLLELAQVPQQHVEDFKSIRNFKNINTNNLWINLRALKRAMKGDGLDLEVLVNPMTTEDGHTVIQLETAAGAAIRHFRNAHGIDVPRSRFIPVKCCSDLLLIKSDVYALEHGQLVLNKRRMFATVPVIKLSDHFKQIQDFQRRIPKIPNIAELDHLTVTGNVYFGRDVTLRGTVIIIADEGQRVDIPDGCVLENRLVSGSLNMIEL